MKAWSVNLRSETSDDYSLKLYFSPLFFHSSTHSWHLDGSDGRIYWNSPHYSMTTTSSCTEQQGTKLRLQCFWGSWVRAIDPRLILLVRSNFRTWTFSCFQIYSHDFISHTFALSRLFANHRWSAPVHPAGIKDPPSCILLLLVLILYFKRSSPRILVSPLLNADALLLACTQEVWFISAFSHSCSYWHFLQNTVE